MGEERFHIPSEASWQSLPLTEAREIVRALDQGEIQAFVTTHHGRDRVFILQDPDAVHRVRELRETRQALERSEGDYRTLFELAGVGMTQFDLLTGRFLRVNRRMCQITGYPEEELLNLSYLDFTHPEDRQRDAHATQQLISGEIEEYVAEKRYVRKDGTIRWVAISAVAIRDESGKPVRTVAVVQDITDRKRAEAFLDESLDRLHLAQLASESGAWDMNYRTNQTTWTPEYYQLYGHPPETKPSYENWKACVHPEDRERADREIRRLVEARATRCVVEFRRVHPERGLRWLRSTSHILYDDEGPLRMIGLAQDITEAHRLEQELRRSNDELQNFASIVAHDLRSPLLSINGCAELLAQAETELSPENRELVRYMQDNVKGMGQLIQSLLAFTRIGHNLIECTSCDMAAVFADAAHALRALVAETKAQVTVERLPSVSGDGTMLAQLFQNLLENAIKYRGGNAPVIHVDGCEEHGTCTFSIRDNGVGIDSLALDRIFQPFYRVGGPAASERGVGLGLATCRKIVERHGGRIWAESTPGRGAVFFFTLPCATSVVV